MKANISPPSPDLMTDDLSPREAILPLPFDFALRKYSKWLYPFISRYNYGSQTPYGDWSQISKTSLKQAIATSRFRYLQKLTERHLKAHLEETMTYYYTGSRRLNILLLCLDVDAHNGQPDAPALADYLATRYLRNNCAIEPSTNKKGRHMYFLASIEQYTPTATLFTLTKELNGILEADRKRAGFQANIDPDIGGLPSDWKNDKMAHLMKLPRPKTPMDLQRLLALQPMPLGEVVAEARKVGATAVSLGSLGSVGSQRPISPNGEGVPCVSSNIIDCGTQSIIDSKMQDAPPLPLGNPCVSTNIIHCENKYHSICHPAFEKTVKALQTDVEFMKTKPPLERANWTVRMLAQSLGRMPHLDEALAVYDKIGLGTGPCTPRRIRRFDDAIDFTGRTFDPKKIKKSGFLREYPVLRKTIQEALEKTNVFLKHGRHVITVDNLVVAYYFAKFQLGRGDEKNNYGTLPLKGILNLSEKLHAAHPEIAVISTTKGSACRNILCQLGLLELTDSQYQFWGVRRAKRYRLK